MMDGMISQDEYHEMKKGYAALCAEAEQQAESMREEMGRVLEDTADGCGWMDQFKKHRDITSLDRVTVVTLKDRIFIYRDRRVEIRYNWQDEFQWLAGILAQEMDSGGDIKETRQGQPGKGAV